MLKLLAILLQECRPDKIECRRIIDGCQRRTPREEKQIHVSEHVGDLQIAQSMLHRPEELPRATQPQILLRET